MRNFLIIIIGVIAVNAVVLYSGGFKYIQDTFAPEDQAPEVRNDMTDAFKATLEAEVRKEIGMPIEGYEPAMFLQVFPGLAETDFDGVQASIGKYVVVDGKLTYQTDDTELIHSAAGAITREGMKTLLGNIATRTGIDIQNGGTLTEVMTAISGG